VRSRKFDPIYLENLRLWQLIATCKVYWMNRELMDQLSVPLQLTYLILVHSTALSIRFRMDEKKFDVDGSYNVRYEIVKKRIDKALIKGSNERLTQPGKIAVVYSNTDDRDEYLRYFEYLTHKQYLTAGVEILELEELQGVNGLHALRVTINPSYQKVQTQNNTLEMIEELSSLSR
jgi:hypothetical protein